MKEILDKIISREDFTWVYFPELKESHCEFISFRSSFADEEFSNLCEIILGLKNKKLQFQLSVYTSNNNYDLDVFSPCGEIDKEPFLTYKNKALQTAIQGKH